MAIYLDSQLKMMISSNGKYDLYSPLSLDLKSGKQFHSDEVVLYASTDVKKLARALKITYVQALKYFEQIAIDDHSGAGIYIPKTTIRGAKN